MTDEITQNSETGQTDNTEAAQTNVQGSGQGETPPEPPKERLAPQDKANVILSNNGKALPEGLTNFGQHSIQAPSEEQQRAGFFYENPGMLIAQWPQFKYFRPKGEQG